MLSTHRLFVFIVSTFVFFITIPHTAQARNACPKPKTSLVVKKVKKDVTYIRGQSVRTMTQLHAGSVRVGGPQIYGLGGGTMGFEIDMDFQTQSNGSIACVSLNHIEGRFIVFPAIMIAQEFGKGSCEFNAVYEHEKKHVAALMSFQNKYAYKFKNHLKKVIRRYGQPEVVSPTQIENAKANMQERISTAMEDYFQKITPIIQRRQISIDSEEEYARVFKQCTGWGYATAPRYQRRYR